MRLSFGTAAATLIGLWAGIGSGADPAAAQDNGSIDLGIVRSADLNRDGKFTRGEIVRFADLVFLSMDANGDEALTFEEFRAWDPGYVALAERSGKAAALDAAKREVFGLRDLNGDGRLELDEHSVSSLYDFYKADADRNRSLSQREFLEEYRLLREVRAAVR
jgi:hypothetical protein